MSCEMETILFGVDPGKTTGFVTVGLSDGGIEFIAPQQYEGFERTIENITLQFIGEPDFTCIIESYASLNTPFHADANWACQVIGAIRWELYNHHGMEPVMQRPQERLFITDTTMKKMDYWIKGQEHSRQALKHVLTYCIKTLHHPALLDQLRNTQEEQ